MIFNHDGIVKIEWVAKPGVMVVCTVEEYEKASYDTESNFLFAAQGLVKKNQLVFTAIESDFQFEPEISNWKLAIIARNQVSIKKALVGIFTQELMMEDIYEVNQLADDALKRIYQV